MDNFDFYIEEFGGTAVCNSEDFSEYAALARQFILDITHSNADFEDEDIKNCLCALTEIYYEFFALHCLCEEELREKLIFTADIYLPPLLTGKL